MKKLLLFLFLTSPVFASDNFHFPLVEDGSPKTWRMVNEDADHTGIVAGDTLNTVNGTANVTLNFYANRPYITLTVIVSSGGTVDVDVLVQFAAPKADGGFPTDGDFVTFTALTTTISATGTYDIVFNTPYPRKDWFRVVLDGQGSNASDTAAVVVCSVRDN